MPPTSKIKLVISDFHLSRGKWLANGRRNPLEDFHQDDRFEEFLNFYSTGEYENSEVELIVNGDFFDPLAVIPLPGPNGKFPKMEYPQEVEESAAVEKISTILDGHPISVQGLKNFLARGKKIVFRWGNHDAALLWPAVQKLLRQRLAPPQENQIEFQQRPYVFDRICVDHGHQYETLNHFDENHIFIERKTPQGTKRIQNLPFGSFFVMGFLNRVKLQRSYINLVQPLRLYIRLSLLLEPMFFFVHGFLAGWFFIKMRFITHPMRFARLKKTLMLIFEAFRRVSLEDTAEAMFQSHAGMVSNFDTIIMGHNHQATVRVFPGGKQYINTGTWIPITSLDMNTLGHRILRTYALIEYIDGKPRASLKIWHGEPHLTDDFA
ncbi:MAG: metallophosphoesterase [Bdellovibrio sp.]|nr:metallophosphoesterase [Bdellovibrio sp.]